MPRSQKESSIAPDRTPIGGGAVLMWAATGTKAPLTLFAFLRLSGQALAALVEKHIQPCGLQPPEGFSLPKASASIRLQRPMWASAAIRVSCFQCGSGCATSRHRCQGLILLPVGGHCRIPMWPRYLRGAGKGAALVPSQSHGPLVWAPNSESF